jgi:hypothetical protein
MKNNFQKIQLVFSALFFIMLSVAFVFLYKKINDNNQKAEKGMVRWQEEAKKREDTISLNSSLEKIAPDLATLGTHFAQSSDVVPFLDTIEKLAPKVGATAAVDSVSTLPGNIGLLVGLKANGSFTAIYKFLTLLENSPYELNFISMDINKIAPDASVKGVQSQKWEATFKMQLLTFVP